MELVNAPRILALNCGSSSLKFGVFDGAELLFEGEAEEIGRSQSSFWTKPANGEKREEQAPLKDYAAALCQALGALKIAGLDRVDAVGHRIVHGGPKMREHQKLDANALNSLQAAVSFAPLHLPAALAMIEAVSKAMPDVEQVLCLDTAFHRRMPDVAATLPLPEEVRALGVERFGFHGLSLESVVAQLHPPPERMVVAHLGSGCSITAIQQGRSIDTSMGLTPTGGVMMGTRTGDLDPGVLIFLMRHGYADADGMETLLDHQSGLKGVSGTSSDMRDLAKARDKDQRADLALRMFAYQVRKTIAGMIAALGGLDLLVFTGGIGEHDSEIRADVVRQLGFCGPFEVKILPAEEDLQIARITARLLAAA